MKEKKDKLDSLLGEYYKGKSKHYNIQKSISVRESEVCFDACELAESIISEPLHGKCPSIPEMVSMLDGSTHKEQESEIQEHVKHCRTCKRTLKYGKELVRKHKEGKLNKTPKELSAKIASQLGAFYRKATSRKKK